MRFAALVQGQMLSTRMPQELISVFKYCALLQVKMEVPSGAAMFLSLSSVARLNTATAAVRCGAGSSAKCSNASIFT